IPDLLPVDFEFRNDNSGETRTFHFSIVKDISYAPIVLSQAIDQVIDSLEGDPGNLQYSVLARFKTSLSGEFSSFTLKTELARVASEVVETKSAGTLASKWISDRFGEVYQHESQPGAIESVQIEIHATEGPLVRTLERITVPKGQVTAGE